MLTKALLHNRISPTLNTTDLANKYVLNTKLVSRAVNFLMAMAMAGSGWSNLVQNNVTPTMFHVLS